MLWTREGLYIGFQGFETSPVFGHPNDEGSFHEEDVFEVFLDPIGDHRQYVEIQANPGGLLFYKNYLLSEPPRSTEDRRLTSEFMKSQFWRHVISAPPGAHAASKLDAIGGLWTLEIFLPKSFVNRRRGGTDLEPGTWRINIARYDWDLPKESPDRKAKFYYWSPVAEGCPHLSPEAMGYLDITK